MVKLNVDGDFIEGVVVGCGRDDNGCWIGVFSKNVGICSSYMIELWGLLEGSVLVLDLRFIRLEVNIFF